MICRQWHGWTTPRNAAAYQALLTGTMLPAILARDIDGLIRAQAMQRDSAGEDRTAEVEHMTLIWFTSVAAVKAFVGVDYERAHVPEAAQALLKRWDANAVHYRVFDMQDKDART